jgi:hypothetical protein
MAPVDASGYDLKIASRALADAERQVKQLWAVGVALAAAGVVLVALGRVAIALCSAVGVAAAMATIALIRGNSQRLLTDLVAQGDALGLAPVREHAQHLIKQRTRLATCLRRVLADLNGSRTALPLCADRLQLYADRIEGLASAFADQDLPISPVAAALCARLLWEPGRSPLYNDHLPVVRLERLLDVIETGVGDSPGIDVRFPR